MALQLAPVPQPIGIFDSFIARQTETLVLKEKILSFSDDSFDIKLESGYPILRVQGRFVGSKKSIFDMAGNHLFDMKREHFHLHTTYALLDPQGNKFFELKSGFALIGSKFTATFTSSRTGKPETLVMKGNFFDSAAEIVDDSNGMIVATIRKQRFNVGEIFFGQQTYALVVAPGVDMALLSAMCICLDEMLHEE